ncbi:DUF2306 domain-containing protein [Microbacterium sp. ZW T2_14]|uniref:DUF2306 domain-containing protein n=1 Tax=Microbacterium sp. ZW T2_14 TaxID=3378079 RepID=UPI0038531B74
MSIASSRPPQPRTHPSPRRRPPEWLVPAGLIALSLVPVVAGAFRVTALTIGVEVTPENARFFASPIPVILHAVGASVYLVLGALQFAPSLRRRRWHRIAGRILVPAGLTAALSGVWMAVFYAIPTEMNGPALIVMRVVLGTGMAAAIVVAFLAIRRGDVPRHSAWMTRAYAIGLGAGTQVLTLLPWTLALGTPSQTMHSVLMGAAWAINLAVAEVVIRRRARRGAGGGRPAVRSAVPAAHLS